MAAQEQDWPRVRNLQKPMLRSRANTLVSVRQVTRRNAGCGLVLQSYGGHCDGDSRCAAPHGAHPCTPSPKQ